MKKQLPVTKVNIDKYCENSSLIDEMIEKFGPAEIMLHLYEREDFIIPNWFDYKQIASMWGYTEESVKENWSDIQYMIKKVVEQGGFNDVQEQGFYLNDFEINLVESENLVTS
jgi:hypothetical protein